MVDQAAKLRDLMKRQADPAPRQTRILTVTSGKGGVGKSNFTLNFALTLQKKGYSVLIFDADIGLANIDVLMGTRTEYNLYHLLKKEKSIEDIIHHTKYGIQFIAGGSGFRDLLRLSEQDLEYFAGEIDRLNGTVDYILFDTGAGLSKETLKFILAAQETVLVTTPEPTAITDAYAMIKVISQTGSPVSFHLVVNRVTGGKEGKLTAEKITLTAKRFLQLDIPTLGYIPDDSYVTKAVKKQIPFTVEYPHCQASRSVELLAERFLQDRQTPPSPGIYGLVNRMLRFLKR